MVKFLYSRFLRRIEFIARVGVVLSLIAALEFALPDAQRSITRSKAATVASSGLLLHLNASDSNSYSGSGTAWNDLSGNGKNATLTAGTLNAATSSTPRSLTTGSGTYASLPSGFSDFSNGFSAQATVDLATADVWERIIDFATDYNGGAFVAGDGDNSSNILFARAGSTTDLVLEFYGARGANPQYLGRCISYGAISTGFHNYAVSMTPGAGSTTCAMYKDGVALSVSNTLVRMPDNVTRTANFIAHSNWTADADLGGKFKSLLVYNRPLSSSEVADNWTADRQSTSPGNLTASATSQTSVSLSWAAPSSVGISSITDYVVEYSTNNSSWNTFADGTSTATSAVVTGLSAGTSYYFRVSGVNATVTGLASTSLTQSTNAAYVATFDSQGGSSIGSATWTAGSSVTLGSTPTRAGYTFNGWSTSPTGSTLVYQTTTPTRSGNSVVYSAGYGKSAGDAASVLTSQGANFNKVRYRMEANYNGTLRYADVTFDKWSGANIANIAIPDLADARVIKTNVSNLSIDSNWPGFASVASGVTTGSGKSGRLELWPYDYNTATTGISPAGNGSIYDNDDTSAGSAAYGSFQVHNLTDSQTVLAWNHHGIANPDIGFGNNLGSTHTDWTFMGNTNFNLTTWKLQVFVGDLYAANASFTPVVNADTTFYAQWTPNNLTVTYNSQGGGAINSGTTVTGGSIAASPGTPVRANYDFKGWYTASSGGSPISFPYTHNQTSNFTLYAQWITAQSALSVTGAPSTLAYQSSVTLGTSGGSGTGALTWSTSTPSVCNVGSATGVVTMSVSVGSCTVTATKAADADYYISSGSVTISATMASQSALSVVGTSSGTYLGSISLATSGGTTGGSVTWSSGASTACTVNSSGVVSITSGTGSCSISATMAGNSNYNSVTSAVFSISVGKASQSTLTVSSTSVVYGANLSLTTSGGSGGGSISWQVIAGTCTISSSTLNPGDAGSTCQVRATKATDANYLVANSATTSITITKASQSGFNITNASSFYAGATLALTASGGQTSGSISWSVASGTCSISSNTLTSTRGGITCVVEATRSGDTNYFSSTDSLTVTVHKNAQVLTFRSSAPLNATVGSTYTVSVDSDAFLAPTISIANGSTSICSVTAGIVTFLAVGTCTISATQSGSDAYLSASSSQTISVASAPPTTIASNVQSPLSPTSTLAVTTESTVASATSVPSQSPRVPTTTTPWQVIATTTTTTLVADPSQPQLLNDGKSPHLAAGDTSSFVRGQRVKATVQNVNGTMVITLPNNVTVTIGSSNPTGKSVSVGSDGVLRMFRKDVVDIAASGLVPGTTYTLFLFSTPIEVGRGEVRADGTVKTSVQIPSDLKFGEHTVQVNGVGPSNEVVTTQLGIEVLKKKRSTSNMVLVLLAAVCLALLSGRPIFANRRAKRNNA